MAETLRFATLPDGVVVVRRYRSLPAALVECHHAAPVGLAVLGGGGLHRTFCRVCRTVNPSRPVKLLAVVPDADAQAALF